jgi:hypothetical protein
MAQESEADYARLVYRKEWSVGLNLHTAGWGMNLRFLRTPIGGRKQGMYFDFVSLKHPKETKINSFYENARRFSYGRLNSFHTLRVGYGMEHLISQKTDKGSIGIYWNWRGGYSNGFQKPEYLEIIRVTDNNQTYIVEERYDPEEHFISNIYGRAPAGKGVSEMTIVPGVFVATSFLFEYGITEEKVSMVELGICIDYFPVAPNIMATEENKNLFSTLFININFGNRWN